MCTTIACNATVLQVLHAMSQLKAIPCSMDMSPCSPHHMRVVAPSGRQRYQQQTMPTCTCSTTSGRARDRSFLIYRYISPALMPSALKSVYYCQENA